MSLTNNNKANSHYSASRTSFGYNNLTVMMLTTSFFNPIVNTFTKRVTSLKLTFYCPMKYHDTVNYKILANT